MTAPSRLLPVNVSLSSVAMCAQSTEWLCSMPALHVYSPCIGVHRNERKHGAMQTFTLHWGTQEWTQARCNANIHPALGYTRVNASTVQCKHSPCIGVHRNERKHGAMQTFTMHWGTQEWTQARCNANIQAWNANSNHIFSHHLVYIVYNDIIYRCAIYSKKSKEPVSLNNY